MTKQLKKKNNAEFTNFEDSSYQYTKNGPKRKSSKELEPLAEVLETLYSEHRYFNTLLDKLEEETEKLKPGKIPDFHLLLDIINYLKHYPGKYHHPRENLLFAILLKQNGQFKQHKALLERDHASLERINKKLYIQLSAIVKGDKVNRVSLAERIQEYINNYRNHIDFESKEIFPLATGNLTPSDLNKLRRKTRFINDPLFGGELEYKFQRLARNLSYEIGVESNRLAAAELGAFESLISKLSNALDTTKKLKSSVYQHHKNAIQEQIQTCRDYGQDGLSAKLFKLPLILGSNHRRQVQQGLDDISTILKG